MRHYCWIQYGQHSIVSIFLKILLRIVCKQIFGKIKWTKDQDLTDVVWNVIKNKVNQIKFIAWFLCRPAFAVLVIYLLCAQIGGRG